MVLILLGAVFVHMRDKKIIWNKRIIWNRQHGYIS